MTDIDHRIAMEVMGWYLQNEMVRIQTGKECSGYFTREGLQCFEEDWHPSTSIEQAFMVLVEKMRKRGYRLCLYQDWDRKGNWLAVFQPEYGSGKPYGEAKAERFTEAICLAALKAVEP